MPVLVLDEPGCVDKNAEKIASYGHKALIVTGRHSAKASGALDDITNALEKYERAYAVFNEVEENPSVETIVRGSTFGRQEECDFVIGIGGGSPLDASKAIAFLMHRPEIDAKDLYDSSLPAEALPVIAVPTTCGTGSEVTGVSVLTVHEKKTKISIPHKIFPDLALVDGKYLVSAGRGMLVNTAVDAFAHMAESYMSVKADDYSKAAVAAGMQIWGKSKDILLGKRSPEAEDYANMLRASTFAGIAIAQTGTSLPHALSYILTYDLKIPHGKACGYFQYTYLSEADPADTAFLMEKAGFKDLEEFGTMMDELYPDFEVPEETRRRAYEVVVKNTARLKGCRFPVDEEVLKRIAKL